jgi:TolA-binding protein
MKRFFWAVLLSILATGPILSQKIRLKDDPDELFFLANQLYREKEFPGCYRILSTWFERSNNPLLLEDAHFLRATVAYELNKRDASLLLIGFIKDFPLSVKLPKAYYLLGCTALNAGQYQDALGFFKQCPEEILPKAELDDYRFRYAYASLQTKDYLTARNLFIDITKGSNRFVPSATYFLAYMDYADGKIQEARDGFEKVSDQTQYQNVTDYFKLQLLYIDGSLDEVTAQAQVMLEKKPTPEQKLELVRLLGAAWFDKKRYALSQQYYQEYMAMTTQVGRSDLYRIGINYYTQRNFTSAINYLTQASGVEDAISQSATYHIGLCYLKQNKKDQARMSFEQASNLTFDKPTQEKALYNYALICYQDTYSPFNEQAKAFQRILTEFPTSEYSSSVNNYLSEVFLSSKDYAGSLAFIETLSDPGQKMLQTKCRLLFLHGMEKYNAQQFAEAQQLFTKSAMLAIENNFPLTETLYWKGECNYRLGFLKEAAEDFRTFAQDPASSKMQAFPIASYQLGYAYFNQGLYNDAREWFEKYTAQSSVKKEKTYTDALNRIGDCRFQAKDIARAEKAYQSAQWSQTSGNDYATYQLAICQGARKLYRGKTELLANFEKKFPQSLFIDNALFELGNTYLTLKQPQEAATAFSRLLKLNSESPLARQANLLLADILQEQGKTDEAVATYKKVIEQYPGSEEAQTALKGLKAIFVKSNTVSNYLNYTAGLRGIVKIETGGEDTLAYQTAEGARTANKTTEAIEAYTFYLNHFPSGAFRDVSRFQLGRLLLASGRMTEGLAELDSIATHTGNAYQVPAVLLLAEGYFSSKNHAMALNAYQQLENLAPDRITRQTAVMGVIRCSYSLELYKNAVDAANRMLNDENPGTDIQRETLYYRAMSLLKDEQTDLAIADLKTLGRETHTALGAEARFRLAECLFDEGDDKESEKEIRAFLTAGSPHSYWLARSSVLMADICLKRGNDLEAKQYLTSLKQNYQVDNDVQEMVTSRLKALTQRSN